MNEEQTTETSVEVEETETTEITETVSAEDTDSSDFIAIYTADEEGFYMSFEEFRIENREFWEELQSNNQEFNELIISDINNIAAEVQEYQLTTMVLEMLTCGLLGIIIGICFVNIFKKR